MDQTLSFRSLYDGAFSGVVVRVQNDGEVKAYVGDKELPVLGPREAVAYEADHPGQPYVLRTNARSTK